MTSIGDRLRTERLRRGLDIFQVAQMTKINAAMLEAIEADDLERLPGSFFTRSFVRQYAQALGLDDEEMENELKRVTGFDEAASPQLEPFTEDLGLPPVPTASSRGPSRHSFSALLAFVLIVAASAVVLTIWQRYEKSRAAHAQETAAVHKPEPTQVPTPAEQASQPTLTEVPTPEPTQTAEATPTPTAAPAEPPAPGQTAFSSVAPGESAAVHVQVRATGEAWIQVTSDGKRLYTGVLQANESRSFEGKERMSVRFGDPGAVDVTWNGKGVGEIGPHGRPRSMMFTAEGFKVFTPAPPTPRPEQPAPAPPAEP